MLLHTYQHILRQLVRTQHELMTALDSSLAVVPVEALGLSFVPTHTMFSQQLGHWPAGMFPFPAVAWVEPRQGSVTLRGEVWEYFFHGGEVSLYHQPSLVEVNLGFGTAGELAVKPWFMRLYLERLDLPAEAKAPLLQHNEALFAQLVSAGVLREIAPWLPGDDQVYLLST